MYRFIAFELLFAAAAMALFYYQIWGIFGIDGLSIDTFIYLLQKQTLMPLLKNSLLYMFPPLLLAFILISAKKEKATRLYYYSLIACAEFLALMTMLNITEKAIAGKNLAERPSAVIEEIKELAAHGISSKMLREKAKPEASNEPLKNSKNENRDDNLPESEEQKEASEENQEKGKNESQTGAESGKTAENSDEERAKAEAEKRKHSKMPLPKDNTFFGKNYIPATKDIIEAPAEKKNIILVFMESMEQTFSDGQLCGANLTPFLKETAHDNISFANYTDGYATNWTQAALIAATTGLPSSYLSAQATKQKDVNDVGEKMQGWLYGVYSLGEILRDHGYERLFVQGGSLSFSGAKSFLDEHGFKGKAFGADELKKYKKKQTSWGIADKDIYEIFSDKLSKLQKNQPFFAVLTTIDTHHYNVPKDTPKIFDMRSKDVIYQADSLMKDFLNRFYLQPYSQNTVLIIVGDHLRMAGGPKSGSGFLKNIPKDKRRIYNVFINSSRDELPLNMQRTFSQIDMFPTILEAAGFTVKGHRLGLGVSVFSDEKTLIEKYGKEELKKNLMKSSPLYSRLWE